MGSDLAGGGMDRATPSILYRDEHLLAIDKPAGLLTHRSPIERRERRFAVQMARDLVGRRVYPVHRLDRATSGVLLFALSAEVARALGPAFAERRVAKAYLAVVRGWAPESGRIDQPLKEALCRVADAFVDPDKAAQAAVTDFRCLATVEVPEPVDKYPTSRYSLVEARPRTGRRHQIRRHLRRLGHPIVGDTSYGQGVHNRFFRHRYGCHRLLLAAAALALEHPVSGERLLIRAPLDEAFGRVVAALGWQAAVERFYAAPDSCDEALAE